MTSYEPSDAPADPDRAVTSAPGFMQRLSQTAMRLAEEISSRPQHELVASIDVWFLAFLRETSSFGLFSFGPLSIHVRLIEDLVLAGRVDTDPDGFAEFTRAVSEEQERTGRREIDELLVLLAFMRSSRGLPSRVFGELGVTLAEVEAFARGGVMTASLEPLYSPEDAANYLGIHVQTVRSWIRSGRLRAHRLTGQRALRIKASDLAMVLEPVEPDGDD